MGLSKAELAENLFGKFGLSKHEIKQLIDTFFEEISLSLQNGEHVKISGFGNFELRNKNQRPGRNPKTGEDVQVTARRVVTFRSGQKLRCRIKQMQVNEEEKAGNNNFNKVS